MKKLLMFLTVSLLFTNLEIFPQKPSGNNSYNPTGTPGYSYLNLNNISSVFRNNGISDVDVSQSAPGFKFPKETGKTAVYTSGLLWGAIINDPGQQDPHVGGSVYGTGLQGGKILSPGVAEDPNLPHVRIYRVRPDVFPGGPIVDLSWEASDEGKTQAEVRAQYELDWVEWRAVDGAPYDDVDTDGSYDPNIDVPGVPGASQTIWFVANDLDPSLTTLLYGSQPMGIEYQATYWEYKNGNFIDNLFFKKFKLINKSTNPFNDMYISMWSNPEIGDSVDDFVGCDTTLNLGYAINGYNYDSMYDPYPPPAVGFDLLQGPSVSGGYTLPMTAFYYFTNDDPNFTDPVRGSYSEGAVRFYRFMQGKIGITDEPFINPVTGLPTPYALSGDPLTEDGWIDGMSFGPGDRRMGLASGPFNMAVGDTQEVVIAEIAAIGSDRLQSLKILKYYDVLAQNTFDNGLNISSFPVTISPVVAVADTGWRIELDWGRDTAVVSAIENFNQSGYAFQGYNVYQLPNDLPIKENAVRVATFDIVDGITEIQGIVMDPETGLPVNGIQQHGSDSGIERTLATNYDRIENSHMLVGKKYYFAVTAYTYNPDPGEEPNNSETVIKIIEAVFYDSLGGSVYGDSVQVIHSSGTGDGNVYVEVVNPTQLTGQDYEVYFDKQKYYRDEDGVWVPIPPGRVVGGQNNPDTLTGSTVDIGAIYGPASGVIELGCYFNYVSSDGNWADGISMTFPAGVTIIDAPPFEAGGGLVVPEIIGNTVNMGIVNGSQTGNGVFYGGEEWTLFISTFQLPLTVDWAIYDDGWSGGAVNAVGQTIIDSIGYAFKTENHWNLRNLTRQDTVIEDQTVIMGYDLYTGEYVGDPIVEGFQISVDVTYNQPKDFSELIISGSGFYDINSYYANGWAPTARSIDVFGSGTTDSLELQKDYELRFTGIYEDPNASVVYVQEGTGSIATLYGARNYDIANHPMNPNPGSSDPFTVRIPFEVWSIEDNRQINFLIYDRSQDPASGNQFYAFNPSGRMYCELLPTAYHEAVIDINGTEVDSLTWNLVFWETDWIFGDLITVIYKGSVGSADRFTFTTPDPVVSVEVKSVPTAYQVFQNYPNPFNPTTRIRFTLPERAIVKLDVYDILGQRVVQLINTELNAGKHEVEFDGRNLASGMYIYIINVKDKFFKAKKMILLK